MAVELLRRARELGLDPYGVSFHVGSQQTDLGQWDGAVGAAARMFSLLAEADIDLRMVNIGGGFPAHYTGEVPAVERYARAVMAAVTRHFGNHLPEIIIEPGRSLVGDAGVIQSEVVLISEKGGGDNRRWVYLDVGKFNGLAETMDESIKYRIATPGRGGRCGPVILAGPTCDSADILYETDRVPAAARARSRRQGRDPVGRRLHRKLCLGRVQRLRADPHLLHLSQRGCSGARHLLHQLSQHRVGEAVEIARGEDKGPRAADHIVAIIICEPGLLGQDREPVDRDPGRHKAVADRRPEADRNRPFRRRRCRSPAAPPAAGRWSNCAAAAASAGPIAVRPLELRPVARTAAAKARGAALVGNPRSSRR